MTPGSQLARILHIIPLAARDAGASYTELEDSLNITRDQLLSDLETVTAREFYHPAGTATDIQVALDPDRVRVWTTGSLQRPVRLDLREAAALHLGLRLLAGERDDPDLLDAMRGVQDRIAWIDPDQAADPIIATDPAGRDAIRATLVDAAAGRRRVDLRYLKPDAPEPEYRTVDPYVIAYAEGNGYVVGLDHPRDRIRVFRIDRILGARSRDEWFTVPEDFDPADYLDRGRVYRADDEIDVTVRYSPRVARWITERGEGEPQDDGSVLLTHTVADPGWIVRHVLSYGPDAEVVDPPDVRALVRETLAEAAIHLHPKIH